MYIDGNTIIWISSVLAALIAIGTIIYKFIKWIDRQANQDKEIHKIKSEQTMICYVMLACLDGLKQLGANGEVTKAHERLSKYLNETAHDQRKENHL